ncbi:UNVERIFIED_CONTAM: hypothetical protein Sindi_2685800, partial [Sesamum indicum]
EFVYHHCFCEGDTVLPIFRGSSYLLYIQQIFLKAFQLSLPLSGNLLGSR